MVRGRRPGRVREPIAVKAVESALLEEERVIEIPETIGVKQLAELLRASGIDVIKHLMRNGMMANITQTIDYETAAAVATGLGYQPKPKVRTGRKSVSVISEIKHEQAQRGKELISLKPRPPVVTVMGHVDHGKTKLLDAIRQTNVSEAEAGGITQHIGAYQVEIGGRKITFLDTPGHEAFTAMRARGARATDITVLVVAADDGVMPQTLEAISHARAAGVPIVVAINKIDKPESNPELVKRQLADAGLVVEEWGGDTIAVPVSAKERKGIPELLESLLLVADMEELRADATAPAVGVVIEAKLDKTKGPLTTALIHNGTLRLGDTIVVGGNWGKVKAMYNDLGKQVRRAVPSSPVEILGLSGVSQAGDTLTAVAGERQAKALIEKNEGEMGRAAPTGQKTVSLSNLMERVSAGEVKELSVILKTDVQGSIEPIRTSLERLSMDEVRVAVIHSSTGNVTESDVMLAIASKGIIIGFNTAAEAGAQRLAEAEGVSIRYYNVIYALVDDVAKALKGMLKPTRIEVIDGHAEVRAVFSGGKKLKVAGSYITDGKAVRGGSVRVQRQGKVIRESTVNSLRRFKEDAREVLTGFECGVGVEGFNEFQVGDTLEFFRIEEAA